MYFQLQASTEAGKAAIALAERHADDFATRASEHDRDRTFPMENIQALKESGLSAAAAPVEFGGLGLTSVRDSILIINRLGQGDGSTALAFTMHLFRTLGAARLWKLSVHRDDKIREQRWEKLLRRIGSRDCIISVSNSERGCDIRTSNTVATRVDGGWLVNGVKTFATGSPAADILTIRVAFQNDEGQWRLGVGRVASDSPGVQIMDNWDAMGMRASGSHDVTFTDCFVAQNDLDDIGEYGRYAISSLAPSSGSSVALAAVFFGIAETAHQISIDAIKARGTEGQAMNQFTVAQSETDIATCRAMLDRTGSNQDAFLAAHPYGGYPEDESLQLIKDAQCTKWVVNRKAVEIVDRTITLSGGGGFMTNNILSRLYRDVRAGPLMQPFSAHVAPGFIGKVALGVNPSDD